LKFISEIFLNKFIYRPLLKMQLKKVGSNFRLGYLSEILNPQYFEFGDNFYCGPFAFFGTNKNFPPYVVAGDVPVKILKQRFETEQQLKNTLKITNSKYTLECIIKLHSGLGYTYK